MIRAASLGKQFGKKWVFRHLEFQVAKGECMAITGANGSGKSTLLKLLAGLEIPTEGTAHTPERKGFLAPDLHLYPTLTASEHLKLAGSLLGLEPDEKLLLEKVGLSGAADLYAGKFSTGMRTRLKLAIALASEPEVLLLDEPGSNLDDQGKSLIREVIKGHRNVGAIIVATNDSREVEFADLELRLA